MGKENQALVASARTGLADADSAIVKRLEVDDRLTVEDALNRLLRSAEGDIEVLQAQGIKEQLNSDGASIFVVNGRQAKPHEPISAYIVRKEHILPDGSTKQYVALEIEVSAVNQGGGWQHYA